MKGIRKRIQEVVEGKRPLESGLSAVGLSATSRLYGRILTERARWYQAGRLAVRRLPCTVISVGNITVGGTGKTPMTVWLAQECVDAGFRTAIVSRGYRGRLEAEGGVVSDGDTLLMKAVDAGDEPFMMAEALIASRKTVPVIVGSDRHAAGLLAVSRFAPEIILLDDAFQHLRLHRDLNLLLLDGRSPFGNGRVLPGGPLREPVSAGLRADAVIFTRCPPDAPIPPGDLARLPRDIPVFRAVHRPVVRKIVRTTKAPLDEATRKRPAAAADDRRLFAFSGIARNEEFIRSIESMGCKVAQAAGFDDHHPYPRAELDVLAAAATSSGADAIATTEKDFARLDRGFSWPMDLYVIGIEIDFGPAETAFRRFIRGHVDDPLSTVFDRKENSLPAPAARSWKTPKGKHS